MDILDLEDIRAGASAKSEKMLAEIKRKFNRPMMEIVNGQLYRQSVQAGAQYSADAAKKLEAIYGKGQ